MPISTNGAIITRVAGALYGEYLSNASYNELVNVTSIAPATVAANWITSDFAGKTDAQLATTVLTNLGLNSIAGLNNWLAAQMTAAGSTAAAKGAKLVDLLNSYSTMTADATYGSYATTFNANVSAALTASQTAGSAGGNFTTAGAAAATAAAAAATAAAAAAAAAVTASLSLTSAVQSTTGTSGDDTLTANAGTWNTGDTVNGGAGTDTLNAVITGTGPTQSATSLVSVEVLNLTATPNPATLDLTGVTGLTAVNNVSSANGATLSVTGLGNVVNTTITGGNTSTSIAYTTAAVAGTADAATLTLNGTTGTSASGSSFTTSGVETLTVNSATSANSLTSLTDTGITRLNITGSQNLTVNGTVGGATIATVDASAATGAITLTTGAGAGGTAATGVTVTAPTAATAGLFTITTGANRDTVNLGAGTSAVSTGAGNDTINSGAGNATITPGAGNDVVNAGAGVDTVRFDAAAGATNADTINNFGTTDVLSINLGRAQVTGASGSAATAVYGSLLTTNGVTATSPTFAGVSGTGSATAVVFQTAAAGTATANTIAQASNVISLTGVFTDGTAAGVISALGATGTTGITTQADSRFLLVTYSVGNIAQVWSYTGDNQTAAAGTSVLTDIDAAELQLVATLNGVASGSLTAANFSTYLDVAAATATATAGTGQTINIGTPLSQVTSTANAAGQYFTSAADTVTVAVGMLPNALASSTAGLTLLDDTAGDGDVLNVTALTAAALTTATMGTFTNNIETVNMNLLIGGGNFSAAANMPGTTTFGYTGTGGQTVTALPAAATIKFDAAASNAIAGTMSASGAFNVALNGSGVAPTTVTGAPTVPTLAMTSGTTSTTTVTGTSYLGAQAGSFYGSATSAATITGSGNLIISGTGATFGAQVGGVSTTGYTGSLTLRPTDAAGFDLSGAGADTSKFTGVRTIDFSQTTGAGAVVLASDNGAWPVTVTSNANYGNLSITQAGSGLADELVISATATAGTQTWGSVTAAGIEKLTLNLQGLTTTATKAVNGVTMDISAATQALIVNSNALATTLGTVTADSLTTTGVAGSLTATMSTNLVGGATFTGNTTQPSYITTGGYADLVTTGSANDAIYVPASSTTSSWQLNGGLGNDTYSLATTNSAGSVIIDTGGVDVLVLTGTSSNISGMNNGGTLASMGIDQLFYTGTNVITVGSNQLGAQAINAVNGSTGVPVFTLAASGTLNVSALVPTQIAAGSYMSATGVATTGAGVAVTAYTLNGSTGADTIVSGSFSDTITGGAGADTITVGSGTDQINILSASGAGGGHSGTFATQAANSISTTTFDVISGVAVGDVIKFTTAYTGAAGAAAGLVANGTAVGTSVLTGNGGTPTLASNTISIIQGTYTASTSTFVGSATGTDSLFVYDSDAALGTTAYEAVVLVGYVPVTVTGIGGAAGAVTLG